MTIRLGIQNLIENDVNLLAGEQVGLVSHPAAVLPDLTHTLDALLQTEIKLTALFGPEHGFFGEAAAGVPLSNQVESRTGLPVYSLYGKDYAPSPEALESVDTLVFDMQDVGARFYTYISTLYHVLDSAAKNSKRVIVCDRPNPLGGIQVEGPLVAPGFESFVGVAPIPVRYGLTIGELALFFQDHFKLDLDLKIISMSGWQRGMWFDETGLHWVSPSTNMPALATAVAYPGTCLIEGTNISEGRGTVLPFEIFGAPWLDANILAQQLNGQKLSGAHFRPIHFTPTTSKFADQICHGVQLHITNRDIFRPVMAGVSILEICARLGKNEFSFKPSRDSHSRPPLDNLSGSDQLRISLTRGSSAEKIAEEWQVEALEFLASVQDYYLYQV